MGIGISDVNQEEAKYFHVSNACGAVITKVEPYSTAAKAGLKVGDVITGLNGEAVNDAGELQVGVGQKEPGTTIHLKVMRDGNSENVPVTLEAMGSRADDSKSASAENAKPRWRAGPADLTPELRQHMQTGGTIHGELADSEVPGR